MSRQFVTEAVMLAIYGQLLSAAESVEYIVPYTSFLELYELQETSDPLMDNTADDEYVKKKIRELVGYLEEPLNQKKIRRALQMPWGASAPILVGDTTAVTIVNAVDAAQFGDDFDPIETELVLTAQRRQLPLLTDQIEWIQRLLEHTIPVQVYDIEDFEFALEDPMLHQP
ncbi:hypothetical protein [Paenibacillus massiliensis]|uniref:hypothetical protein n=1 Tax=Paenibacillus massiliensis TaxID=225917 RepID=UPI00041A9B26|nr:hypothetical protein [Paenibacillus massiliensis]